MDTQIKLEPVDIVENDQYSLLIKKQGDLLIESDHQWIPTKFDDEENEYYQEIAVECNENAFSQTIVKSEHTSEQYTIEYLDENDDYGGDEDYDNYDYPENERGEETARNDFDEDYSYTEYDLDLAHCQPNEIEELNQKPTDTKVSSESNLVFQLELNKWIVDNFVMRECLLCKQQLKNYDALRGHINLNHKESIDQSETNYYFSSDNCGVCKKCNLEFSAQFTRYIHSIRHDKDTAKLLESGICKICNLSSRYSSIPKHVLENHPDAVKEFKPSGSHRNLKCPLCSNTYIKQNHLLFHFRDKHPHEHLAKLNYICYICKKETFNQEEVFLQHLIEKHELNSWKILNYRKVFDDKEYIACTKCNRLFFHHDELKLLRHFLMHENNCYWSCRFCSKKMEYKKPPVSHLCAKLGRYFKKIKNCDHVDSKIDKTPVKAEWKIKDMQEFQEYISHVCPFCNEEFDKMLKWQHHLRTLHGIDSLKGLNMKVNTKDKNKLSCLICHTDVENSPVKLHAHLFQHLPYKPYKCKFCSVTLNTFKTAVEHALKRCKDEDDRSVIKSSLAGKSEVSNDDIRSLLQIQCSFCNYQKFDDAKSISEHTEYEHNYFEEFFLKHADNSMTCQICKKKYAQHEKNSCFMHLHHHFDEKAFKCTLCLHSYTTFKGAYHHLVAMHNAKPLNKLSDEKNYPEKLYISNKDKTIIVTKKSELAKPTPNSYALNEFGEFISYACPECNEFMTTQNNWHIHITTQHNFFDDSNLHIKCDDGSLKCPTCNMILATTPTHQQKHKLTHMPYRSFMCNLCYARFTTLGILYGHFRRKHFAQGSFKCPLCSSILETSYKRTEHLKKTHPRNEWPCNMCLICYNVLSSKSALVKHMVTHDADRLRYTCDVCDSKVLELRDFKTHINRHKMRGEIREKPVDSSTSQQQDVSESSCSNANDNVQSKNHLENSKFPEPDIENSRKKKSCTNSSLAKKKKHLT